MQVRSIITGLLALAAVGGIIFALTGGDNQAGDAVTEAPANPAPTAQQATADLAAAANPVVQDGLPANGVVVYYFHGRQRCYTCNKMETLADTALRETFADHLNNGLVVFRSVNVQDPENNHFAREFELRSAGIVMVERLNGDQVRWHRLDEVWQRVRNDEAFKSYIADNLSSCLRELKLEKS